MNITNSLVAAALVAICSGCSATQTDEPAANEGAAMQEFRMTPIGHVVHREDQPVQLRIEPRYVPGLLGLDGWSHVDVVYWFDENDTAERRAILQVYPRAERSNPLTGVFACRSPVRPNLLAITTCRVLAVEDGVVTVDRIDAFDGSPILDLKPHLPGPHPATGEFHMPDWVGELRGPGRPIDVDELRGASGESGTP